MHTYNVEFQSETLKLKTNHKPEAFEALRLEVESKLKAVQKAGLSSQKALFLTCLHLAEDKLILKKALGKNIDSLEYQAKGILEEIS